MPSIIDTSNNFMIVVQINLVSYHDYSYMYLHKNNDQVRV